jgi:hypothetical protein
MPVELWPEVVVAEVVVEVVVPDDALVAEPALVSSVDADVPPVPSLDEPPVTSASEPPAPSPDESKLQPRAPSSASPAHHRLTC